MIAPGTALGSYRIERLLGQGGMGAVYLAHDTTLQRPVALKIVETPAEADAARSRLLREARNAAALNHPHICTIHEVGVADGTAFIAMEYIAGRSLRDRLDEGALPADEAVRLGIQAADALAYAHDHGVVHRDFKAANAIVTETGRLKIVDFGLARRDDALVATATTQSSLVPPGAVAGTPYAMAPEQVRGDPTDARTDLWALGVLLYEMAAGTKPFAGATIPELFSSILRDAPHPLPDAVPAPLRLLIERCLAKEPDRRPRHAGDVRTDLEAIRTGTAPSWPTWRSRLTHRGALVASTISLLGVGAILVGLGVDSLRDRLRDGPLELAPIKLAVLPFENLTGDPEQEYFSDGLTDEMIAQLGRLSPQRLSVIARTSSMRYKNRNAPIDQIGRELGVDYVLEGSARREGSRIRINATLIQVRDQTQRWANSFDRELASVLTLQGDVARGVAGSLALMLLPGAETPGARARPVVPEAYEAYLKGHFHAQKETRADLDLALEYFEAALQKDPGYAAAHTGIAYVWSIRNQMGYVPPGEATPQIKAAATKALELDDTLALAHYALGMIAWNEWDWETNEREFRRTIQLDPSFPDVRAWYSHLLMALGRPDEAMAQIEHALQLDPLNALTRALYGMDLYFLRRYDGAIAQFQNALKTSPNLLVAHCGLHYALNMEGRPEEAHVAAEGCFGHYGREVKEALGRGYVEAGYPGAMHRVAEVLATGASGVYVAPVDIFVAYMHAGRKDLALQWLRKSVDTRDPNVYGAILDPLAIDSLGDDPRFLEIARRARLPGLR